MISSSTIVSFPGDSVLEESEVLLYKELKDDSEKAMIITKKTPFHPIDYHWPDQPSDKGKIIIDQDEITIIECLTGALKRNTDEILLDKDISVKRDDSDWFFLVVHIVNKNDIKHPSNIVGKTITLKVDEDYCLKLNQSHTASHLAALDLNKILNKYWKKENRKDSLGNIDFDGLAITESTILENKSIENYRIGKSLRKKVFEASKFFEDFHSIEDLINSQLDIWTRTLKKISISPSTSFLQEKRVWECDFEDGHAKIYCGGTHLKNISEKDTVKVRLFNSSPEQTSFIMETYFIKGQ